MRHADKTMSAEGDLMRMHPHAPIYGEGGCLSQVITYAVVNQSIYKRLPEMLQSVQYDHIDRQHVLLLLRLNNTRGPLRENFGAYANVLDKRVGHNISQRRANQERVP
jgi:hypothetical protein